MRLRAGDWVQVRSSEEILATLDEKGCLENLPFMPQMFKYCGRIFQVYKRAHKTCDWVYTVKARRVSNAVHLTMRCDGESFGGCQTSCLLFWKEAWLTPVAAPTPAKPGDDEARPIVVHRASPRAPERVGERARCTEADVLAATHAPAQSEGEALRYVCQATQVMQFTKPLPWWALGQYLEDYAAGNVSLGALLRALAFATYNAPLRSGIGIGRPMAWLYDRFQALFGGTPYPSRAGSIPVGQPTPEPDRDLDLQEGDLVRVRPFKEILATLNRASANRGLYFDAEMVPYCGGVHRVRTRVTKFVDEKTGELKTLNNPAFILEGAVCEARYARCRMLCPRSIYPWWREIWLERIADPVAEPGDRKLSSPRQ